MHRERPQMQTTIKSHQEQRNTRREMCACVCVRARESECQRHRISICREHLKGSLYTTVKWALALNLQRNKSEEGW